MRTRQEASASQPAVRSDTVDQVKFEKGGLRIGTLKLTGTCLLNFVGLVVLTLGFALLMGEIWGLASILAIAGAVCMVVAFVGRYLQTRASRQASEAGTAVTGEPKAPAEDSGPHHPDPEGMGKLTCDQLMMIATLIAAPNVFLMYFFSDIGIGIKVFSGVAPQGVNTAGDVLIALACVSIVALLIFNWTGWHRFRQAWTAAVPLLLIASGSILKGRRYAWAPMLMVLFLMPLGIGLLRATSCRQVRRWEFYKAVGIILAISSFFNLTVWILWIALGDHTWSTETRMRLIDAGSAIYKYTYSGKALDYERHCRDKALDEDFLSDERPNVLDACAKAATVIFLTYASPFIAFVCNGILSAFCILEGAAHDVSDISMVQKALEKFVLTLVAGAAAIYACVNVASASFRLGSTLMAFVATGLVVFLVWGYMEIGHKRLVDHAHASPFAKMLFAVWESDWSKAILVFCFNVLIPAGLLINWLNMKVRRLQKVPNSETPFSPFVTKVLDAMSKWNWVSVLCKVCILGELFFMFQVGVARVTYIFLAWLNAELGKLTYAAVIFLVIGIGYLMFLLPPVPGVPVYVFAGSIISEQGRNTDAGYVGGIIIAAIVAFVLKLLACIGQYGIGRMAGKSVQVQKLIGVDQVPTRAIEMILKEPGLTFGKVAILVGGPDWPTSVMCGILKMSMKQMLIGTLPVIVTVGPSVLAGAFLSQVKPGEDSIWNLLSDTAVGAAALANIFSMLLATYKILLVVQRHQQELAEYRPEHKEVAELTRRTEGRRRAYLAVTKWDVLPKGWKAFIGAAAVIHFACFFIFVMLDEAVFEDFSVSSDFYAELPEGLGGNPFAIVIPPLGWLPIGAFFVATFMHVVFLACMNCLAKKHLARGGGAADPPPEVPDAAGEEGADVAVVEPGPRPPTLEAL